MEPNCIENEYGDLLMVLMNEFAKNGLKCEKSVNFLNGSSVTLDIFYNYPTPIMVLVI